uniref:Putative peptidase n=1 Tax=viral metagenome TaxID=1070528 RepID=A0A6H1ZEX6_9ZZZZ
MWTLSQFITWLLKLFKGVQMPVPVDPPVEKPPIMPPPPDSPYPYEQHSPKIRIKPEQVTYSNRPDGTTTIVITGYPAETHVIGVAPTNSLDPFVDEGMLVILSWLAPEDHTDLQVGDIIDYVAKDDDAWNNWAGAIHRIIEIGTDAEGWYARTKGDNPICAPDPVKVRPRNLRRLFRGVLT